MSCSGLKDLSFLFKDDYNSVAILMKKTVIKRSFLTIKKSLKRLSIKIVSIMEVRLFAEVDSLWQ